MNQSFKPLKTTQALTVGAEKGKIARKWTQKYHPSWYWRVL